MAWPAPLVTVPLLPLGKAHDVVDPVLVAVRLLLAVVIFMSGLLVALILVVVVFILLELVNLLISAS